VRGHERGTLTADAVRPVLCACQRRCAKGWLSAGGAWRGQRGGRGKSRKIVAPGRVDERVDVRGVARLRVLLDEEAVGELAGRGLPGADQSPHCGDRARTCPELMLRLSMVLLALTRNRLAHLAAALMARALVAPRGSYPLAGAASLANTGARADRAVREALALIPTGVVSTRHRHTAMGSGVVVPRSAGEREQR